MYDAGLIKESIEKDFVSEVTSLHSSSIFKIIFFGSRAKGLSGPESDYDFLLVLKDKNRTVIDEIYDLVTDFLIDRGADISLKIYSHEEFKRLAAIPTPFMASVLRSGREVWKRETAN